MTEKNHLASKEHEAAYQDLAAILRRYADKLTPLEILAVAANMVGKLIAMQDQRKVTPELAMKVVTKNLERGNQDVIDQLAKTSMDVRQ